MKKLLGSLALAAMIVAVAPKAALAQGVPFKGTFTAAATVTPNTGNVAFCGGTPLDLAVEAHGAGYSTLSALSLSLQKTIAVSGAMHGCLELTAPNGDTLSAIYDGTEGAPNANSFIVDATGTLTFTGGTGRFQGASGSAHFSAVFRRGTPVMAFYSVEGTVLPHGAQ